MHNRSSSPSGSIPPLTRSIDGPYACIVLVGQAGTSRTLATLLEHASFMKPAHANAVIGALQAERQYLDELLAFGEPSDQCRNAVTRKEMLQIAHVFDMSRALCVILCNDAGHIAVGRQYEGIEVTRLENARERLEAFSAAMDYWPSAGT